MNTAITPLNEDKKICIVIPVYNAEKYLGYCLNSVLSQTYSNWCAILVDDGSTDSSLEICRRYESLDARFHVISKSNGGVSSARNAGLELAEGDYLEFLDSDDCLTLDALEKQISLALAHESELVVTNATILDFNNPQGPKVTLCSNWLNQSPCVLRAEEFKAKRMRLIWHTALLEGPCAKLYDLKLWKELGLKFPEDLSLGEDFVTNMIYYNACSKAVFLNECCYYYNQYMGSGSLTEKYRPDLFEIKMYLVEKLEAHLDGRKAMSAPELDAFYCYVASSGLVCVEKTVLTSGLDTALLYERITEMFAHPLFAESVHRATYIPERFAACIEPIKNHDLEQVIRYIASNAYQESLLKKPGAAEPASVPPLDPHSGLINRIIRWFLRILIRLLGNTRLSKKLTTLEGLLARYGIKYTIGAYHYLLPEKPVSRHQLAQRLDMLAAQQEEQSQALQKAIHATLDQLFKQQRTQAVELSNATSDQLFKQQRMQVVELSNATSDQLFKQQRMQAVELSSAYANMTAQLAAVQQDVKDYVWISEQRLQKYAYQRDINELRQRKKAIMIATAEHANIGDAAITLAEQQILSEQFPDYFQVEISTYEIAQKEMYLHAILNPEDILVINGGGNLGDQYIAEEKLHRKIVSEFPSQKIIIFPQTIHFSDSTQGRLELEKSARVYNSHKDLTLFVRGESSLSFAKEHFSKVKTYLMPDVVHALRCEYAFERSGALLCMRADSEGMLQEQQKTSIADTVQNLFEIISHSTNIHSEDIPRENRGFVVRKELMRFARHQVVITDRLHGMIFSAVTGTPCVVLASYNHKISEYYNAFFRDSNAVFFIGDDMTKLDAALNQAMQVTDAHYPVFESNPHKKIRALLFAANGKETIE